MSTPAIGGAPRQGILPLAIKDKGALLPFIAKVTEGREFAAVHPLSALKRSGLEPLVQNLLGLMPIAPPMYGEDEITDKSQRFLAGELVREQLMRQLGEELPYATTVEVEKFEEDLTGRALVYRIDAVVWVEREGQKAIVIGKGGEPLEREARAKRSLAERFESLLAKADAWVAEKGSRPMVFFANMGPLRQHKARADFSRDFLRAGGLDVVYPSGFQTPEDAARAAAESGCAVCVICSTGDTYPEIVPAFCKALRETRPDMMVALAGYPADYVEAFKGAGVDIFIHVKANCYNTVEAIQNKIGL